MIISMVIDGLYNMADTFFVGLTGNDAMLAAVTVCMPAFMFLSAISNLFGIGGARVISRALGARDKERSPAAASFALCGCLFTASFYAVLTFIFLDTFVDLLGGTDPAVHENSSQYMKCTVVLGGTVTSVGVLLSHLIRAEGRGFLASFGLSFGGVLNIILDPFFVLPRFLGMGAEGAGLASLIGNCTAVLYLLSVVFRRRKSYDQKGIYIPVNLSE